MTIAIWPPDLPPRPSRAGFSRGIADGRLFSENDRGSPKTRLATSAAPVPVAAPFVFTTDQLLRFERFWREDTNRGTALFWMIDPVVHGQVWVTAAGEPVVTAAGATITRTAYDLIAFGKQTPAAVPLTGVEYRVSFELWKMPR